MALCMDQMIFMNHGKAGEVPIRFSETASVAARPIKAGEELLEPYEEFVTHAWYEGLAKELGHSTAKSFVNAFNTGAPLHAPTNAAPAPTVMRLHYFLGRGLGEQQRFALGAAGVEWEDVFIRTRADMEALLDAGKLKFQQLPLLECPDGTQVVQSGAIVRHVGRAYGLYGATAAEATEIDQLLEGIKDFGGKCPGWPSPEARAGLDEAVAALKEKWLPRYAAAFEAQLAKNGGTTDDGGGVFLVGTKISIADSSLLRYTEVRMSPRRACPKHRRRDPPPELMMRRARHLPATAPQ
jgi:glutathione S-transferase